MQKKLPSNRRGRWLVGVVVAVLATFDAQAQLAGNKTIPGSYPTLAAAITDLNTQGVGAGGVTFNIAAGYTETAANLLVTATGTSANPIVFQKSGTGANPLLTAGVGTTTGLDVVLGLSGSDYVTIDGLDIAENAANTTATTQMEFGYALFRASATDGCQFNIIRNCVVTLNKTNVGTIGMYGAPSTAASTTAITATATTGANSSNKVYGNVVTNALTGIYFAAGSATTTANYDQNNEIGVTAGNTIGNFGGTASGYGAGGTYQNGLKITSNTINSTLNYTSATASTAVAASTVTSTLRGIYTPNGTSSSLDITNNTITLASGATSSQLSAIENGMGSTPASNTVNITGNTLANSTYATATTATTYLLYTTSSPATLNITNNTVSGNTIGGSATASATCYLIYNSGTPTTANVSGNVVTNNTAAGTAGFYLLQSGSATTLAMTNNRLTGNSKAGGTSTSGSLYCLAASTAVVTATGNTVSNNSIVTAGTASATIYGYYDAGSPTAETLTGNSFTSLSISGSTTSTSSTLYGMFSNPITTTVKSWTQNTVGGLSLSTGGTVQGIYTSTGNTIDISRNKVYDLSVGTSSGVVNGIYVNSGTTVTVANNLVGDLRAPASTSLIGVSGIYASSPTTANLYYNTINLAAASTGATFGTSGIYFTTTLTTVDLRNNLVVNKSTAVGTGGYTAALRRASGTAGTVPTNLATTTNNNLYYAGMPSATSLIYVEGTTTATNAQQTLAAYKGFVASRETNSVTEDVAFLSTTGTAATFLHINPATATQVESTGTPISGITLDFDGDVRNTTTPDLGADEGTFTPQDLTPPSIVYTALGNTASLTSRTLTATITDASGVATGPGAPRIYYRKSTGTTYFSALATSVAGSTYTFTIDYANLGGAPVAGDVIQYYVAAQDAVGNAGTSPAGGAGATPPGSTAPATPASYQILSILAGTYYVTGTVGSSPAPAREFATFTAAATAYNNSGLGGAVTFVLLDASYGSAETFPIVLNANSDASATNTLTIRPATGVAPVVSGSVGTGAIIKLNGADYITIDGSNNGTASQNLTITNTSTTTSGNAVLWLASASATDGATNNVVKNTILTGSTLLAPQVGVLVGGSTSVGSAPTTLAANSTNTLQNNQVYKAGYGVILYGAAAASDQGNMLVGNQLGQSATNGFGIAGIQLTYQAGTSVMRNLVSYVSYASSTAYGINLSTGTSGITVNANNINNITYTGTGGYGGQGIRVASGVSNSGIVISNNFISALSGDGFSSLSNSSPAGIYLTSATTSGVSIVYNSVNLTGSSARSSAIITAGLGVEAGPTGLTVQNNVFANSYTNTATSTSKAYALYSPAPATAYTTLNNNDYYVSGTQGVLAYVGSADVATLAALRTATSQDASSINADPIFTSATDLHVASVALNAAATPIASITTDIDGDVRNTTTPDIGADEFTPPAIDLAAASLVAPATTSTCYGTAEPVSVSIRNAGTSTLNFASNAATVTVVVTLPSGTTQTFTTTVNTGTLASNATQTVTLPGTLNMSTVGTYSFAITATVVGDGNAANNVLTPVPTRTVTAPVAGTLSPAATAVCISGTVALTLTGAANGSIQFQSSPDNVTFTDIAGATSATYTTPVLTTTTYYRVQVRCNTGVATSNVSTITVSNPLVASANTPVAACAGSSATLTATASAGSSVRFFSTATGGTALATGGTYTTPALTANTTYYVEAFASGLETVGKSLTNGADGTNNTGGLYFTTTGPTTIATVTVYQTATATAGTATIQLLSGNSITGSVLQQQVVTLPANTTGALLATPVTLNFAVPAAGLYTLFLSASTTALVRDYSSAALPATAYPYTVPSGTVRITDGSLAGYYYFFYNWQISSECVNATRTAIQVTVTQPATATFSYPTTGSRCAGSAGTITPTLGTGATAGTFTSTTGLAINATTGVITLASSAAGTYTVTNTIAASGSCPATTATATIIIDPAPVANAGVAVAICSGGTAQLGVAAVAGNSYSWSPATGLSNATMANPTVTLTNTTSAPITLTYTLTVTNASGCSSNAALTVTVNPVPTAVPGAAVTICSGATGQLGAAAVAGLTYAWSPSTGLSSATIANPTVTLANTTAAPTTQTYTLTVTSAAGCLATGTVTVTVNPAPARPTLSASYNGTQTTLTSSAATGNQFYFNGTLITGATGQSYVVQGAASTYGSYTVVVTNSFGCASQASVATVVTSTKGSLAGASVELYPNPTPDGRVELVVRGLRSATELTVLDALGRVVAQQELAGNLGEVRRTLDLSQAASGVYVLRLRNAEGVETRRLTRE